MSSLHDEAHLAGIEEYPPILTLNHIVALFGLANERAAQNFINRHDIPHQRLGRVYTVLLEDLLEWLRDRTETGVDVDLVDEMFDDIVGRDDEKEDLQ